MRGGEARPLVCVLNVTVFRHHGFSTSAPVAFWASSLPCAERMFSIYPLDVSCTPRTHVRTHSCDRRHCQLSPEDPPVAHCKKCGVAKGGPQISSFPRCQITVGHTEEPPPFGFPLSPGVPAPSPGLALVKKSPAPGQRLPRVFLVRCSSESGRPGLPRWCPVELLSALKRGV